MMIKPWLAGRGWEKGGGMQQWDERDLCPTSSPVNMASPAVYFNFLHERLNLTWWANQRNLYEIIEQIIEIKYWTSVMSAFIGDWG